VRTLDTGRRGEDAALARYLGSGYRLIARNWTCALGEVDLILLRGRTLVVCEVKTRRGSAHGAPFEAVTWRKQRKLRQLAEAVLIEIGPGWDALDVRFDVASVMVDDRDHPSVHLFEAAF
jgi:putative endonuclease